MVSQGIRFVLQNLPAFLFVAASFFLLGDAISHVRQVMSTGDFARGNAGLPFYLDLACPLLAIVLLALAKRASGAARDRR